MRQQQAFYFLVTGVLSGLYFASCTPKPQSESNNGTNSGNLKTVTINQPDLKKEMISTLKDDEKAKVYDSLVYQITINVQKKDGKDDCLAGSTPSAFDSGVTSVDKKEFADIKVKRAVTT